MDVKIAYEAIYYYCTTSTLCEEGEELSMNDILAYFDSTNFNEEYIFVHLEADGENLYEYAGIVNHQDISKSDLILDED